MDKIVPCLWFNMNAEEAVNFYTSVFPNSRILAKSHYTEGLPGPEGAVLTIDFELEGRPLQALNGGPEFPFTEAISLSVTVDTQQELDRLWDTLISGGGEPSQCGWLKDKFGLSWQIVPGIIAQKLSNGADKAGTTRMMQALMKMQKLDIAELEKAYAG
jgi:predicted 3-demethylubiquinone-9 3-methyltransferase (glyoxalase superfamily)